MDKKHLDLLKKAARPAAAYKNYIGDDGNPAPIPAGSASDSGYIYVFGTGFYMAPEASGTVKEAFIDPIIRTYCDANREIIIDIDAGKLAEKIKGKRRATDKPIFNIKLGKKSTLSVNAFYLADALKWSGSNTVKFHAPSYGSPVQTPLIIDGPGYEYNAVIFPCCPTYKFKQFFDMEV